MILQKIKAWLGIKEAQEEKIVKTKTGVIKYFNRSRGFGFIQSRQTLRDVFVHIEDANDRIDRGDRVQFEVERNEKGLRAKNVELVGP